MSSHKIGIITDSTCDIPQNLVDQYGIIVIPQFIVWGDEQYRDRIDMQPLEFYQRLAVDVRHPTSAVAGVPDFQQAYEQAARQGAQEIIIVTLSSAMSGLYQTAQSAAELVDTPVSVVDAKGPSMSIGWQALAAARAREAGMDLPGILNCVAEVRKKLILLIGMETMQYLERSGRIGGAIKWVGSKLQVKPFVSVNHQTGLIEPVSLARTHKALVEMLYSKFSERVAGGKNLRVAVLHGNAPQEAEALAERIRVEHQPLELLVHMTGPILGSKSGPGALAICSYAED